MVWFTNNSIIRLLPTGFLLFFMEYLGDFYVRILYTKMPNNPNQKIPKKSPKFLCESCDYKTNNKKDYMKHTTTLKHSILTNPNNKIPKKSPQHICECGRKYKHLSSLSNHKKKCMYIESEEIIEENRSEEPGELKELVIKLMTENADIKNTMIKENAELHKQNGELQKQNYELQKQVLDVCKNIQPSITNSHNNNNNKTFNLQFFLNEQCKDAMNITDFANSVILTLKDLENVGSSGYIEGISSIIIKELKGLDVYKRPMHCSDAKRETLYVKDEDKWEKECSENKKIKKVIKNVEHKNIKMISKWTEEHPKFLKSTDVDNDQYLHIVQESMGGPGDIEKKENKIVKKIAKEIIIEK